MAVLYNSVNVDEKYSSILEPNLFANSVMQPGITFTDKYEIGPAGGIFVHKLGTKAIEPGTPGRDFKDENVADELIPIVLNNNFQRSRKIYGVQANAVSFEKGEAELSLAIQEVRDGWQNGGLACLIKEGTAGAKTPVTEAKNELLSARTALVKKKAHPNVVLCSPEFYELCLKEAGDKFEPIRNDRIAETAKIGTWLGFVIIECNSVGGNLKYYNHAGSLQTVDTSKFKYAMYDYNALSIISNFEATRLIDSERFVGTLAQVEMNTGYKVTNADCTLIRITSE